MGLRALQGFAIAPALPSAMALITEHFAWDDRGRAMGILGTVVAASTALAAPLGGVLTHWMGWPTMFAVAVPIASVGAAVSLWQLGWDQARGVSSPRPFDYRGALLFTPAVIVLMVWLHTVPTQGFTGLMPVVELASTLGLFVTWYWHNKRSAHPFFPTALLRHKRFRGISGIRAVQMAILYGVLLLVPVYWETVRHVNAAGQAWDCSFSH